MPGGAGTILEIDLDAIAANWAFLGKEHAGGPVAAVVKADGYGLGAVPVASRLARAGCRHFFTAHAAEATDLRAALPDAPLIAALNGLPNGAEATCIDAKIAPVLGSLAEIMRWQAAARHAGRALPALLHVDTGMNRLGLDAGELAILAAEPARLENLDVLYVMSHLVASEMPEDPVNECQRDRFAAACAVLPPMPRSLANSSGIFLGPAFGSDLARPGAALYGLNPTPGRPNPMRTAVRLLARVLQVRDIPAGETVGYNGTWRAARPSRIAAVCLGYADGWHRNRSNRGAAFFDGRALPLVGRVSMDLTTYDATEAPGVEPGGWLELLGPSCPPDSAAEAAGTIGYDVLTALGRRLHRVYHAA